MAIICDSDKGAVGSLAVKLKTGTQQMHRDNILTDKF